jgi:integrase
MVKRGRSEKTKRFYEFCFARLNHWHDKPLSVIASNPDALANEHARIARQHRRKGSEGNGAADGTLAFLGRVYNRARAKGGYKLPPWPNKAVEMFGPRSRAHRGMGAKDLLAWWREAQNLEPIKRQFVLFLLLSGLRANDAMTARWEHVNESEHMLLIPHPKGHRDDKPRLFKLPISHAMSDCLRRVKEEWIKYGCERSAWLFPSMRSVSGHIADARAQYTDSDGKEHYVKTGHDLRHSFANVAKEAGVPEEVVGRLMNHKPRTITGTYSDPNATPEFYFEMMERISRKVMEAIGI